MTRSGPPTTEKLLLGPGPSPVSDRVRQAMTAPLRSHLDPEFVVLLDDVRARLRDVFKAPDGHFTFALSGTGTTGMDAAAVNLMERGMTALCVVNGYFGDRLARILSLHGAFVERLDGEWGRAIDPAQIERAMSDGRFDALAVVHGETSTGVLNPVGDIARIARNHDVLFIVDAVTSLGAVPVEVAAWAADVCYSCSQKGVGAPSGLAPITFSARARQQRYARPAFCLDIEKLEDFWMRRSYHHTISAPMIYALHAALVEVEEEGLEARWKRHQHVHAALVAGLQDLDLSLLPPAADRLVSLNTVSVPKGVDAAAVKNRLLDHHHIEIGAGLGPLAGRIWRIGLMGSGATTGNVDRVLGALAEA
ncbi:MAG TPA: alanine--glyoxylate aminotransferase family protein, partial [Vicinamibacterales bacterium]|nr:alanine--glyoxylate aminotransferase family protein [Vicinamibacterales bacterium]